MKSTLDGNQAAVEAEVFTSPALLVNADKLAEMLDISVRTLWRLRSAGKLPLALKVGGCVRWRLAEVHAWIDAGCPNPGDLQSVARPKRSPLARSAPPR